MQAKEMKAYLLEDTDRLVKVLESYNFHSIWFASQEEVRCATPTGENRTSVSILLQDELYATCFSDNFSGDIYGLIQHFSELSFIDVLKDINQMFGFSVGARTSRKLDLLKDIRKFKNKSKKIYENEKHDISILDQFINKQHVTMLQEAISPKVLEMFQIRFDPKLSRIIIPHFDDSGEYVVGIQGRHTESAEMCKLLDINRYWNYIKSFRKNFNLFAWCFAKDNVNETKYLILFEGEKSVMKHTTMNYGTVSSVALGSHALSDYQVQKIIKGTNDDVEIIIAMDNDIEEDEIKEMCAKFSNFRKTSYIFDQYKILGEKASPVDKGYKKFDFLFRHRRYFK